MANVNDVLGDIRNAAELIDARRAVDRDGESHTTSLQQNLANSVASKVSRLVALSPNDAKLLLDAIKNSGFSGMGKQVVISAIDSKLETELDGDSTTKASTKNMLLVNAPCWVTESLVKALGGKGTINVKIAITAEYLAVNLQCDHPHEQTLRSWLTLTLLQHFEVWPKYHLVYDYLQMLKEEIVSVRKKPTIPRIIEYPKVPHELHPETFNALFPDEPPAALSIDRFLATTKHVPLRKNSKLITAENRADKSVALSPCRVRAPVASPLAAVKSEAESLMSVKQEEPPAWAQELLSLHRASVRAASPGGIKQAADEPPATAVFPVRVDAPPAGLSRSATMTLRSDSGAEGMKPCKEEEETRYISIHLSMYTYMDIWYNVLCIDVPLYYCICIIARRHQHMPVASLRNGVRASLSSRRSSWHVAKPRWMARPRRNQQRSQP